LFDLTLLFVKFCEIVVPRKWSHKKANYPAALAMISGDIANVGCSSRECDSDIRGMFRVSQAELDAGKR
jgi:hypothetical protein